MSSQHGYVLSPTGELLEADPEELELEREAQAEYERCRTGLTFGDVRRLLAIEQAQARAEGQYMFVSRSTVLGRWHELKQNLCRHGDPTEAELEAILDVECPLCGQETELEGICVDCGRCPECCTCEVAPADDFWRENPWGGEEWLINIL